MNYPKRICEAKAVADRVRDIQKSDRLLHIINYGGYAPHRGYIDWGFDGKTLLHTGKYIKYPKNSNCQRWIKRETSRRIRSCRNAPAKELLSPLI